MPLVTAWRVVLGAMFISLLTHASAQPLVRVLLAERAGPVSVVVEGAQRGAIDGRSFATPFALTWPLEARAGSIWMDGRSIGRQLDIVPESGVVTWDGGRYRGSLRVVANGDVLMVLNVVDLESYLRGVVPAEMQAIWPLEALRAQAVAARTYTLANLDPAGAYDVCATTDCQVYRGMAIEHPRTDQAIADTAGQVLTYEGLFARTFYHSDSGGVIASSAEVWGMSIPYLSAFRDVPSDGPHSRWETRIDPVVAARHLAAAGYAVGTVQRVVVTGYSESGRISGLEVVGSAGRVRLDALTARLQVRAWGLKSTLFTMTGDLSARGAGWGHGVGMSQYGARELALAGYAYAQILGFYYPETQLQRVVTVAER